MRRGVTLLAVLLLVMVISILTASITISSSIIIEEAKKNEFVLEYINIQREVASYYNINDEYPVVSSRSFELDVKYKNQFENEDFVIANDKMRVYELHILDLSKLGITDNRYGKMEKRI